MDVKFVAKVLGESENGLDGVSSFLSREDMIPANGSAPKASIGDDRRLGYWDATDV